MPLMADTGSAAKKRCSVPGCDIDKGFVDGYALDARGLVGENRHDLRADLVVAIEMPMRPNGLWAQTPRLGRGHGRMHTKATCLVRARGHDAA